LILGLLDRGTRAALVLHEITDKRSLTILRELVAACASKQDRLIAMLQRPTGASIDDLMAATGWQRHSVRGVLSGVVRKKRGLKIKTAREGTQLVYRIVP